MVREKHLEELFNKDHISSFPVLYVSSELATIILTNFKGQVIRTEVKDYLLIEGRYISAIHINDDDDSLP